ncbi:hypothetical protein Ciccas_001168 [Cichlidogyrus casuarinus]|uniref:Snurportin-1 n=1 Tax=Cichlidogyrus casuarinus TaxID=1844966 RepID=A0ABD2QNT7_9PLAT
MEVDELIEGLSNSLSVDCTDRNILLSSSKRNRYIIDKKRSDRNKNAVENRNKRRELIIDCLRFHAQIGAESSTIVDDKLFSNPWASNSQRNARNNWSLSNLLSIGNWLEEWSDDIHSDYLIKLCPVGKHVLVYSERGNTYVFSRAGYLLLKCQSNLPGGSSDSNKPHYSAVLDCIVESSITAKENRLKSFKVYVLDVLYFNGVCYENEAASSRFNWLSFFKLKIEIPNPKFRVSPMK